MSGSISFKLEEDKRGKYLFTGPPNKKTKVRVPKGLSKPKMAVWLTGLAKKEIKRRPRGVRAERQSLTSYHKHYLKARGKTKEEVKKNKLDDKAAAEISKATNTAKEKIKAYQKEEDKKTKSDEMKPPPPPTRLELVGPNGQPLNFGGGQPNIQAQLLMAMLNPNVRALLGLGPLPGGAQRGPAPGIEDVDMGEAPPLPPPNGGPGNGNGRPPNHGGTPATERGGVFGRERSGSQDSGPPSGGSGMYRERRERERQEALRRHYTQQGVSPPAASSRARGLADRHRDEQMDEGFQRGTAVIDQMVRENRFPGMSESQRQEYLLRLSRATQQNQTRESDEGRLIDRPDYLPMLHTHGSQFTPPLTPPNAVPISRGGVYSSSDIPLFEDPIPDIHVPIRHIHPQHPNPPPLGGEPIRPGGRQLLPVDRPAGLSSQAARILERKGHTLPEGNRTLSTPPEPPFITDAALDLLSRRGLTPPEEEGKTWWQRLTGRGQNKETPPAEEDDPGLSTDQIEEVMKPARKKGFVGVVPRDEIHLLKTPKDGKPMSFICNLDDHTKDGSHWTSVNILPGKSVEFYNSLGEDAPKSIKKEIAGVVKKMDLPPEDLKKMKYKYNRIKFQSNGSNSCAWFASKFLQDRLLHNKPFPDASGFTAVKEGEKDAAAFRKKYPKFKNIGL